MAVLLALSTFPDRETAQQISNQLVTEKFAACANILPAVESIYRWKEKIETGNETLVFFKLSEDRQNIFYKNIKGINEIFGGGLNMFAAKIGASTRQCGAASCRASICRRRS